jgi:hypothetical protein
VLRIFIALEDPSPWPGSNCGSSGNHCTTKATLLTRLVNPVFSKNWSFHLFFDETCQVYIQVVSVYRPVHLNLILITVQSLNHNWREFY